MNAMLWRALLYPYVRRSVVWHINNSLFVTLMTLFSSEFKFLGTFLFLVILQEFLNHQRQFKMRFKR